MGYALLEPFLPNEQALHKIEDWLRDRPITIRVTKARKTKLGDFKRRGNVALQISVNGNLPKSLFFFVLSHEIAHYLVFLQHGYINVKPHGKEWKSCFGQMLLDSLAIYPQDLQVILQKHALSPKANFYSDPDLSAYFRPDALLLKELREGEVFKFNGRQFKKGNKRRIRYICTDLNNHRTYLIHASAPVERYTKRKNHART